MRYMVEVPTSSKHQCTNRKTSDNTSVFITSCSWDPNPSLVGLHSRLLPRASASQQHAPSGKTGTAGPAMAEDRCAAQPSPFPLRINALGHPEKPGFSSGSLRMRSFFQVQVHEISTTAGQVKSVDVELLIRIWSHSWWLYPLVN